MARLLVIDDDNTFREMIVTVLQHEGHIVAQAATGQEGVALFNRVPADVVITDMLMPIDSIEGVIALRHEHPEVPFIVMSGLTAKSPLRLGIAEFLHAEHMLDKPFKLADLLRVTNKVLAAARLETSRSQRGPSGAHRPGRSQTGPLSRPPSD